MKKAFMFLMLMILVVIAYAYTPIWKSVANYKLYLDAKAAAIQAEDAGNTVVVRVAYTDAAKLAEAEAKTVVDQEATAKLLEIAAWQYQNAALYLARWAYDHGKDKATLKSAEKLAKKAIDFGVDKVSVKAESVLTWINNM